MLNINKLNLFYQTEDRPVWALRDLNLHLEAGKSYGIVGESGSGKTTLAMAILGLLPASAQVEGEIFFEGDNLLELPEESLRQLRWTKLAVVFQASMNSFSPVHRVSSSFEDIYLAHRPRASKREVAARAKDLFDLVNLDDWVYRAYPHELSGGMMQRVNIALSLMLEPDLLIMDEATTALDVLTEKQILEELLAIEQKVPLTRIMITHDVSVVASSCQEVLVMYAGCLLEQGPVDQVFDHPCHPYTEGLLSSFPDLNQRGQRLQGIPGSLPDLREEGHACPFADRCPHAQTLCYQEKPLLTPIAQDPQTSAGCLVDPGHYVACHFPRRSQDE